MRMCVRVFVGFLFFFCIHVSKAENIFPESVQSSAMSTDGKGQFTSYTIDKIRQI